MRLIHIVYCMVIGFIVAALFLRAFFLRAETLMASTLRTERGPRKTDMERGAPSLQRCRVAPNSYDFIPIQKHIVFTLLGAYQKWIEKNTSEWRLSGNATLIGKGRRGGRLLNNIYDLLEVYTPALKPLYYTDIDCLEALREIDRTCSTGSDGCGYAKDYQHQGDLRFKSDICRYAALWKHGGFYFDVDTASVKCLLDYINPHTTLFTAAPGDWPKTFPRRKPIEQLPTGWLGAVQGHHALLQGLHIAQKMTRVTHVGKRMLLGPNSFATVLKLHYKSAYNRLMEGKYITQEQDYNSTRSGTDALVHIGNWQFLQETYLDPNASRADPRIKRSHKPPMKCPKSMQRFCDYVLVDTDSGDVVFWTRVAP